MSYEQQARLEILSAVNSINSAVELNEFKNLIAHYFATKAQSAIDKLCEKGEITASMIDSWGNEHMRTSYRHAANRS